MILNLKTPIYIDELLKGLYVDDGRILHRQLRLGERFDEEKLKFEVSEEEKAKGEAAARSRQEVTRVEVLKAMNSISLDLTFTMETCSDFEGGKLPTLSLSVWQDIEGLKLTYFDKVMRNQVLLVERIFMSRQSLISILSNELRRRMEVISQDLAIE